MTVRRRRLGAVLAPVVVLACAAVLLACTAEQPATDLDHAVAKEAATQAPDLVDVTLYFRQGRGPEAALVPVVREVPVGTDLARTALDLMLAGPLPDDPGTLRPPVPTSTVVRSFAVDGGVASVDLSGQVVSDAEDVGRRPEHELLALAAIANTLTEFPEITRVEVTVDGEPGGEFWGGWGLPHVLFRDDSVIATEAAAVPLPDLGSFSFRRQEAGTLRPTALVTSVRIRPRSTYLRVTMELAAADGADLTGSVPRSQARRSRDGIRFSVDAGAVAGLGGEQVIDDPAFDGARVEVSQAPPGVRVTVRPGRPAAFALRTLTDPTRVVLDIRR